jgi:hypothetical protein
MVFLINENLIWVATPKCVSKAIEKALLNSNLKNLLVKIDIFTFI